MAFVSPSLLGLFGCHTSPSSPLFPNANPRVEGCEWSGASSRGLASVLSVLFFGFFVADVEFEFAERRLRSRLCCSLRTTAGGGADAAVDAGADAAVDAGGLTQTSNAAGAQKQVEVGVEVGKEVEVEADDTPSPTHSGVVPPFKAEFEFEFGIGVGTGNLLDPAIGVSNAEVGLDGVLVTYPPPPPAPPPTTTCKPPPPPPLALGLGIPRLPTPIPIPEVEIDTTGLAPRPDTELALNVRGLTYPPWSCWVWYACGWGNWDLGEVMERGGRAPSGFGCPPAVFAVVVVVFDIVAEEVVEEKVAEVEAVVEEEVGKGGTGGTPAPTPKLPPPTTAVPGLGLALPAVERSNAVFNFGLCGLCCPPAAVPVPPTPPGLDVAGLEVALVLVLPLALVVLQVTGLVFVLLVVVVAGETGLVVVLVPPGAGVAAPPTVPPPPIPAAPTPAAPATTPPATPPTTPPVDPATLSFPPLLTR
ncbi:hypothetical protein MD484_g3681, partial [Candolleomyces efflorescens]